MEYDYSFLHGLRGAACEMFDWATMSDWTTKTPRGFPAHCVMEGLALYLINSYEPYDEDDAEECADGEDSEELGDWSVPMLTYFDMEQLFSVRHIAEESAYHFNHWTERRFGIQETDGGEGQILPA